MSNNPIISVRKDLTEEEKQEKGLLPDYSRILDIKLPNWNDTLQSALAAIQNLDLAEAAKSFRKIATDLKHTELEITSRGTHSPKNSMNDLTGKEWLQHTKSWVVVDGTVQKMTEEIKDHPASFPPDLAEYFISYFTKQGQWVLDPFMGIGSTAEACWTTKRNCVGIELNPKYMDYSQTRIHKLIQESNQKSNPPSNSVPEKLEVLQSSINKPIKLSDPIHNLTWLFFQGDIQEWSKNVTPNTVSPISFVITSPPYWNMLRTSRGGVKSTQKQRVEQGYDAYYSDTPADLGNISDYDVYLAALVQVFENLIPFLAPKAHLMIILQNCRTSDGQMRPIAWDFARLMNKSFKLLQEFLWCQDQKFMGIWGWPTTYVSNVHHHYCLVFQRLSVLKHPT